MLATNPSFSPRKQDTDSIHQLTTFDGRDTQNSVSSWRWNGYLPLCPTAVVGDQMQVELCHHIKLESQTHCAICPDPHAQDFKRLSSIPHLTIPSSVIFTEQSKIDIQASPRQVRASGTCKRHNNRPSRPNASQSPLKETQARDSLASNAKAKRSKRAAPSKLARRVVGQSVVSYYQSHWHSRSGTGILGEDSVSYD